MRREGGKKGQQSERYQKLQIRINLFRSMVSLLSFPQIKQIRTQQHQDEPRYYCREEQCRPSRVHGWIGRLTLVA